MIDHNTRNHYTLGAEGYTSEPLRKDRYGKVRTQGSPGHPRGSVMKLAAWIDLNKEHGKTRAWLAEELKVHPGSVDQWCNGRRKPRVETIAEIEKLTDGQVTLRDWITLAK